MTGWTEEGLKRSWRALIHQENSEEWRFVHLTDVNAISIEAGCHFPDGREALIFSFPRLHTVHSSILPEGKGFDVLRIENDAFFSNKTAIALVRKSQGSPDIFSIISVDILRFIEVTSSSNPSNVMEIFLERVKEWQVFMSKTQAPLSLDAQVGLFGELFILKILMNTSLGPSAIDSWLGPLRAAQDFQIRNGAIEVKSTVSKSGFLAKISSIEQLDSDKYPFFLCALRFQDKSDGITLVDFINDLRKEFDIAGLRLRFESLLMIMRYFDCHSSHYLRVLKLNDMKLIRVDNNIPRLLRTSIPLAIRSASYMLDLDMIEAGSITISEVMEEFEIN